MNKEDAQLICPISYEDPDGHWSRIEGYIDRLPLRDVSWKSPISSSYITINNLPLRFLPSSAPLFKDTDHSYRWFLSPYVNLYILGAETLDAYKSVKSSVKKWVELQNTVKGSLGKSPWIIIYVSLGIHSSDTYNKVYSRIASDFYVERSGDRTVMLQLPGANTTAAASSSVHHYSQLNIYCNDLLSKLREGIVLSFQHRSSLYDNDIRKIDATRSSPTFDFKQYFLVKESLALLYQMMQLPDMALGQYEEIEAMLSFVPPESLPDTSWPMSLPEAIKLSNSTNSSGKDQGSAPPPMEKQLSSSELSGSFNSLSTLLKDKDCMNDAVKNGDEVLSYSMNAARPRILKNKMSLLELNRYVFARQMYFLKQLKRPVVCAQKALKFLVLCSDALERKFSFSSNDSDEETRNIPSSKENLQLLLKLKQCDVWAFSAAIKILRACRDLADSLVSSDSSSNHWASMQSISYLMPANQDQSTRGNKLNASSKSMSFQLQDPSHAAVDPFLDQSYRAGVGPGGGNPQQIERKDAYSIFTDILNFAFHKFGRLTQIGKYANIFAKQKLSQESELVFFKTPSVAPNKTAPKVKENPLLEKASSYFSVFTEAAVGEVVQGISGGNNKKSNPIDSLQKDLIDCKFLEANSLESILSFLAQRIRSVSHFWAKLFQVSNDSTAEPSISFDLANLENYTFYMYGSAFSKIQLEKGKILEVAIYLLMKKAFFEITSLSKRYRFAAVSYLDALNVLLSAEQSQLALAVIHQLLSPQVISNTIIAKEEMNHFEMWEDLRWWLLQGYITVAKRYKDEMELRRALCLAALTKPDRVKRITRSKELYSLWFQELIRTSRMSHTNSNQEVSLTQGVELNKRFLFLDACQLFRIQNFLNLPDSPSSHGQHSVNQYEWLKSMIIVNEEQYLCSSLIFPRHHQEFLFETEIQSFLDFAFPVDQIYLYFKASNEDILRARMCAGYYADSSFSSNQGNEGESPLQIFETTEDEFRCVAVQVIPHHSKSTINEVPIGKGYRHGEEEFCLYPGRQRVIFRFSPSFLGKYCVDRICIVIGSLCLYINPFFPFSLEATLNYNPLQLEYPKLHDYGLRLSHDEAQRYFDQYPLIEIVAPSDLVAPVIETSRLTPADQEDTLTLRVAIEEGDVIEEILFAMPVVEDTKLFVFQQDMLESNNIAQFRKYLDQSHETKPEYHVLIDRNSFYDIQPKRPATLSTIADPMTQIANTNQVLVTADGSERNIEVKTDAFKVEVQSLQKWIVYLQNLNSGDARQSNKAAIAGEIFPILANQPQNGEEEQNGAPEEERLSEAFGSEVVALLSAAKMKEDNCLRFLSIEGNQELLLSIPYFTTVLGDLFVLDGEKYFYSGTICFTLHMKLRRGGCLIPLEINLSKKLYCGPILSSDLLLNISPLKSSASPEFLIASQLELFNLFIFPIVLVGFRLVADSEDKEKCLSIEDHCTELPYLKSDETRVDPTTLDKESITLDPFESYMTSFTISCKGDFFPFTVRYFFQRKDSFTKQSEISSKQFYYDVRINHPASSNLISRPEQDYSHRSILSLGHEEHKNEHLSSQSTFQLGKKARLYGKLLLSFSKAHGSLLTAKLFYMNPPAQTISEERKNLQSINTSFTLGAESPKFILSMLEDSRWLIAELTATAPTVVAADKIPSYLEKELVLYSLSVELMVVPLISGSLSLPGLKISTEGIQIDKKPFLLYCESAEYVTVAAAPRNISTSLDMTRENVYHRVFLPFVCCQEGNLD